jgi:FtsP/CotA-like multicopper oxidase with cupredoxin domain
MPIPHGTTSFTMSINGGAVTNVNTGLNGAQGWYALRLANGDSASLSLVADGINYMATLLGRGGCFVINFK